jgi:hypothetical protein
MANSFTNIVVNISDGPTVPSIDLLATKTYVDIGNGTVFKLSWNTPTAQGNSVAYYTLNIYYYNKESGKYITIFNNSIGNVNEYSITSSMLSDITYDYYKLYIQLTANSSISSIYNGTSDILTVLVGKGCGAYTKVTEGYSQPIMKRALGFVKLGCVALRDKNGEVLADKDGKILYANKAKIQSAASGWALMQEFYAKDSEGNWHSSDIS